jgi:3-hydroxyacyl-CoA dehydrogenase/enoyl-CoA hydratase/3-hydroxybutyryl-CoA epimerase
MHYFSPVERMPLLEIVVTEKTSGDVIATAADLGRRQGKTVIVVNDAPGFYTTRILGPYVNEAARMLGEGVSIRVVDGAMEQVGFPVGPFELLDEVGIDVAAKIATVLHDAYGDRMAPPPGLASLVAAGRMGRKKGLGFYTYEGGKRRRPDPTVAALVGATSVTKPSQEEISDRLILAMVNEAARCLDDGVLSGATDGDLGAVLGLGFPPHLGGPFAYLDRLGAGGAVARLRRLAEHHGSRFEPSPLLTSLAERGGSFHG